MSTERQEALPIKEPWTPGHQRILYDPFAAERAEMRGSTDRCERVCAWIAGCWPEPQARAIEKVTDAEFHEWKIEHPALYDRAFELARGMLIAEMRASGLGISSKRNQKSMAISLARAMGEKFKDIAMTQWDSRKQISANTEPEQSFEDLEGLSPEEVAELAALED